MEDTAAIRLAVELVHGPARARQAREQPLPAGVEDLLRIAAGEIAIRDVAATALDRPPGLVSKAASFFIEQVLFSPGADSYRVLGARPDASCEQLRRNMALLLRWVHPDVEPTGVHAPFAVRVIRAWDDLKTAERRQAYDAGLRLKEERNSARSGPQHKRKVGRKTRPVLQMDQPGLLRRAFFFLFPRV